MYALASARALGVKYSVISIEGMFEATLAALKNEFAGTQPDALCDGVTGSWGRACELVATCDVGW